MIETRFRVGDIVRIASKSGYTIRGPKKTDGIVTEINDRVTVKWQDTPEELGHFRKPDTSLKLRKRG